MRSPSASLERTLRRAVLLPIFLAIVIGAVFLTIIEALMTESARLRRSEEVIVTAERLRELAIDLETGMRGYQLTGDEHFLAPYDRASAELPQLSRQLRSLVAENAEQSARAAALQRDIEMWRRLNHDVRHRRSPAEMVAAKAVMDRFRLTHNAFLAAEYALSERRANRVRVAIAAAVAITIALAVIAAAILTVFIRRQLREIAVAYEQAVTAAEDASAAKDQMLATVSHELRTPLAAILGWTQMLRRRTEPDRELAALALESIEQSARLQSRLVEDLLDVSRMVSGTIRIDVAEVDLGPIVTAATETLEPAARAKNIDLTQTLPPDNLRVRGDSLRLQQIFANLLNNAVRFTPPGGRVSIDANRHDGTVRIVVRDTGVGIAPEFLPHVFEPFRQERDSTKASAGLGLGLAIARRLVELHGGIIEAHSEGVGRGCEFVVQLPVASTS